MPLFMRASRSAWTFGASSRDRRASVNTSEVDMRWIAALLLVLITQTAFAGYDGYKWTEVADVQNVTINVNVVTQNELDDLMNHRTSRGVTGVREGRGHGLALLYRNN